MRFTQLIIFTHKKMVWTECLNIEQTDKIVTLASFELSIFAIFFRVSHVIKI